MTQKKLPKSESNKIYQCLHNLLYYEPGKYKQVLISVLDKGFDIDYIPVREQARHTLLQLSIQIRHAYDYGLAILNLEMGADVNVLSKEGNNALYYAVRFNRDIEFVRKILQETKDINVIGDSEKTAFYYAICNYITSTRKEEQLNAFETVKLLIRAGADPSIANDWDIKTWDKFNFANPDKKGKYERLRQIQMAIPRLYETMKEYQEEKSSPVFEYEL